MSPRISSLGLGRPLADSLYVNVTGDTMTGSLILNQADLEIRDQQGTAIGTTLGQIIFSGTDAISPWVHTVEVKWDQTLQDYYLRMRGGKVSGSEGILDVGQFAAARGVRATGNVFPAAGSTYDLGLASPYRWRDLRLSRDIYLDGQVYPADQVTKIGTSALGLHTVWFSDSRAGSNRERFRGCRINGFTYGDIYFGADDLYAGFYVQKTVQPGSTAVDHSGDITNLYQGDSTYPVVSLMYGITRVATGAPALPYNGVEIGAVGGCGLQLVGPSGGRTEHRVDSSRILHLGQINTNAAHNLTGIQINLSRAGTLAVYPGVTNSIELGTTSLRWKNLNFAGKLNPLSPQTYSVTNLSTDRTYDAAATSTAELANVLGTLIGDLRTLGLVL